MADVIDNNAKTVIVDRERGGHRHGLDGKDAAFLGTHFSAAADRDLTDAIRDGQRHIVDVVHTVGKANELATEKVGAANALATATAELRLSKEILKEACETRELVREEAQKTRDLINANELQRVRDDLSSANASLLALRVQVGNPV